MYAIRSYYVTTAEKKDGCWIINGTKRYITNGSNPMLAGLTVLALTGEENGKQNYSTILVERNSAGFSTKRMLGKMMWRASDTAEIKLKNVEIPQENLLGIEGRGLAQMLKTLDSGRLSIAAMGLGLAQGAYEMALDYAQKRKQFSYNFV